MLLARAVLLFPICLAFTARSQEVKILQDYESEDQLKVWTFKKDNDYFQGKDKAAFNPELSDLHATSGKKSLKIAPNEYLNSMALPKDWSGYDALEVDVFV